MLQCSMCRDAAMLAPHAETAEASLRASVSPQPQSIGRTVISMSKTTSSAPKSNGSHTMPQWDAQATLAEFAGLGRENFDAFVRASTIAAQGYGVIAQHWADFAKATVEQSVETARAVMTTKNVKDAIELQSNFARSTFDRYVHEASKLSELGVKTTTDAFAPIQKRVDDVVAKYNRAA